MMIMMCRYNLRSSFLLLVVGLLSSSSINFCVSAPAPNFVGSIKVVHVPSSIVLNEKFDVERVTSEIKQSLDLILALTANGNDKALARQVTDAVVVLKQSILQNPNPILREAVINALIQVGEQEDENNNNNNVGDEEDPLLMFELQSFLQNLKDQVSVSSFPPAFSTWMNNHIVVLQNFIKYNTRMTTTTSPSRSGWTNQQDDEAVKEKFQKFKSFIQDGLKSSRVSRPETLNNVEFGKVNNLMESGEFDTALANMLIDADEDNNNNPSSSSSSSENTNNEQETSNHYSLNFVQAIKDVYNRATPDLHQPLLSVLRALEKNGRRHHHQRGSPNSILYKNSISQGL